MPLLNFLYSERSGTRIEFLAPALMVAGLAYSLIHNLGWMAACDGATAKKTALLPLAAGIAKSWQWDCEGNLLLAERNVARDPKISRIPEKGLEETGITHTGEKLPVITWRWPGDNRIFAVPKEILGVLSHNISLSRDVIIVLGHLFREQHYPKDRIIETSFHELAGKLCLEWAGGRLVSDLEDAILIARWLTIKNHPVIKKIYPDGRVREKVNLTYGFVNYYEKVTVMEGKNLPRNKQPLRICLSELYAFAIKNLPAAPIPVAALEAAHKAPQKLRTPAKSLTYYLASRVPLEKIQLSLSTLADILGYQSQRKDKLRLACENVLKVLHPIMIRDFQSQNDIFTIVLAGKTVSDPTGGLPAVNC